MREDTKTRAAVADMFYYYLYGDLAELDSVAETAGVAAAAVVVLGALHQQYGGARHDYREQEPVERRHPGGPHRRNDRKCKQ